MIAQRLRQEVVVYLRYDGREFDQGFLGLGGPTVVPCACADSQNKLRGTLYIHTAAVEVEDGRWMPVTIVPTSAT